MDLKKYKPILEVVILAVPLYIGHRIVFSISDLGIKTGTFQYSLEQLYAFFLIASVLILFVLVKIKEKNLDNVGNVFMLLTCVKMALSYLVLRPILLNVNQNQHFEKINFFAIFMLFLAIETIIAVRLLNNKQ
jgi:hypothetical protein